MQISRTLVLTLLVATSVAIAKPLPTSKPEQVGMSGPRLDRITALTQQYVDEGKFAGVVTMVARKGKVVYFNAVGQKGVDDPRPVQKDDLFRIYSMSKPITAVAAMQLYEQGKFHLSDPVSKYVPEIANMKVRLDDGTLVDAERPMTMHQLLTHTTGLGYGLDPRNSTEKLYTDAKLWESKDLDELAQRISNLPLRFQPGQQWHYSLAVDVTGLVVQRLSGMPLDEYLKKNIFEPLGMTDTFFEVPEAKRDRFLPNHYLDRKTMKLATIDAAAGSAMTDYFKVSLFSGGGGLVSTAMDYMRFCEALRNGGVLDGNRILGAKTIKFMASNHLPANLNATGSGEKPTQPFGWGGFGFGLGFGVVIDDTATGVLVSEGEYNWGGAAGTVFWIDPLEDVIVVSMVQLMGSPWSLRDDLRVATYQSLTETSE